jgi:hypothetical protein
MDDITSSSFFRAQRSGAVIVNPMSKTRTTVSGGDSGFRFHKFVENGNNDYTMYWDFSGNFCMGLYGKPTHVPLASSSSLASARNEAVTAALAGVQKPDMQGLVSLAEIGKTVAMLSNPMRGIRELLLKGSRKGKGDTYQRLQDSYLEYRYGWRPLMYDVESIVKALHHKYNQRLTSRATRTASDSASLVTSGSSGGVSISLNVSTSYEYTVRAGVLYEHTLASDNAWGTRLSDIPSAAWELVPFSFVVDWFVNVGDYISALTPKAGVNTLGSWVVEKTKISTTRTPGAASYQDWICDRSPSGADTIVTESTVRRPSIGAPSLTFTSGGLRSVLSDMRALDSFALLTQQFKRIAQRR